MGEKRTKVKVAHASFWYVDEDGRNRVALRGEEVEVGDADIARGEAHGAFVAPDAELAATEATVVEPVVAEPVAPARSADKAEWETYARSLGYTDGDLDGLTKAELVDLASSGPPAA